MLGILYTLWSFHFHEVRRSENHSIITIPAYWYESPGGGRMRFEQGVPKRCRLSWLTSSALVQCAQMRGGGELRGLSQCLPLYTGAQINFWDLTPNLTDGFEPGTYLATGRLANLLATPHPNQLRKTHVLCVSCPKMEGVRRRIFSGLFLKVMLGL